MNNKILTAALAASVLMSLAAEAAVPEVDKVKMTQDASRLVTITYELSNAPAVVTLDITTNHVSIGGKNIDSLMGDVNMLVTENGTHTIYWRPDHSWNDHRVTDKSARAVVTAWATDDPPDYMTLDLSAGCPVRLRFYPGEDFLPGGILSNTAYRTSKLVMRKIHAKDVEWTMGSLKSTKYSPDCETPHAVKMTEDYYIGVFQITQSQYTHVIGVDATLNPANNYATEGEMRPREKLKYSIFRMASSAATGDYPTTPASNSFLGRIRALTGEQVAFDLPSEAQWEFACRAGHGEGYFNDGSSEDNFENLLRLGMTSYSPDHSTTAIVGSYTPNDWGLYDMYGNVCEFCLDLYKQDITGNYSGAVITSGDNTKHVLRGGCRWMSFEKDNSWSRLVTESATYGDPSYGFRVAAPARLVVAD